MVDLMLARFFPLESHWLYFEKFANGVAPFLGSETNVAPPPPCSAILPNALGREGNRDKDSPK